MNSKSLSLTLLGDLNELCDAFEDAWRAGKRPRIEECLEGRAAPLRTVLFQMLLEIEVELRREAGERIDPAEYVNRFETYSDMIRTMFASTPTDVGTEVKIPSTAEALPSSAPSNLQMTTADLGPGESSGVAGSASVTLPDRIGPYQIIKFLGEGNFVVFLARDERNGCDVAIKVARPNMPESRRRLMSLLEEAAKIKALRHPRIVRLYEYVPPGQSGIGADGYIVLEYVDGRDGERTLEELLRAGPVPMLRLIRIVALVAESLHYAHTHPDHLIHRDLKPANILLDLDGDPRICDFGLALNEDIQRLRLGEVAGTPPYMAPEQVRGEAHRLDGRTDIWALGVILYRGLTGRLPFPGADHHQIFDEILHHDPRPLRMYEPGIEPELERIVLRCLARSMADRYRTACDLADDLTHAIDERRPARSPSEPILYKGLTPFDVEDARFFLALLPGPRRGDGTPESIRFWEDRVESVDGAKAFSVGVLYGPSGGGKSSFVRAGLLPNLNLDRVRPVYIEATPCGTEARLLAELHREAPELPDGVNLPDAVALAREDPKHRTRGKLFLVLDQFEQWLQAHPDEPDAELVRALQQCDGRRVAALVVVRDDFWMAVTRFLQTVDVPLAQGVNAAAVELFDARHTRNVLEGFGRALGQLPEAGGTTTAEGAQFLDEVSVGLADAEGRVIPMRMSLFVEVVRHRKWTPETLRGLGGVDGIGVKFLDDCFTRAEYKHLRGPAQAVLGKLLPPPTSAIRGRPCSEGELRRAADTVAQPADFAQLTRVLTGDLRLVTVNLTDGATASSRLAGAVQEVRGGETRYQLAHDFLVRPIRQWLERDQGSTRKGRARLRLELITASWLNRPGSRQLPSLLEWAGILRHIPQRERSTDERRLMRTTARHYATRGALALAVVASAATAAAVGVSVLDTERARDLFHQAIVAEPENLRGLLPRITAQFGSIRADLERVEGDTSITDRNRVNAAILLHRELPTKERAEFLRGRLLTTSPAELAVIREALGRNPATAGGELLLHRLRDASLSDAVRLRAGCALAGLAKMADQDWELAGSALVRGILREDRSTHPQWLALLGPPEGVVIALLNVCVDGGYDPVTWSTAAEALGGVLVTRRDSARLARALAVAQPEAALVLLGQFERLSDQEDGVNVLVALGMGSGQPHDEQTIERQAWAVIALATIGRPDALVTALDHQLDPRLRTVAIQKIVTLKLAPRVLHERLAWAKLGPAQRQAVLLVWAESRRDSVSPSIREDVLEKARESFQVDLDPGVHSAAELLIRRWDSGSLPRPAVGTARLPAANDGKRGWMVGPNGHQLAYLRGPLEFRMGSPAQEENHVDHEQRHFRRIERSLLVATTETTAEQYNAFAKDLKPLDRISLKADYAVVNVSWYDAIDYCNWLSRAAGLEPFFPEKVEAGTALPKGGRDLGGFRLPTEAEWEYICRAETETSRPFGESMQFLDRYAWTSYSSGEKPHPVGQLLPNDFGVFDMLGNPWEWCLDGPSGDDDYPPYPKGTTDHPALDPFQPVAVNDSDWRFVRGGSFARSRSLSRSAHRDIYHAGPQNDNFGFRVVRTFMPKEEARQ
jgi:eukaryotic-like serine/threonine-protein kinase